MVKCRTRGLVAASLVGLAHGFSGVSYTQRVSRISALSPRKTTTDLAISNMISTGDMPDSTSKSGPSKRLRSNSTNTLAFAPTHEVETSSSNEGILSLFDQITDTYLGSRLFLAAVACLYGTNFPLGSIMDHALPPSAATSARMVLAALALSPFLSQLPRELIGRSILSGSFTAIGYVTQSMALVDTSPATVSFLGALTVIWCPFLEWVWHKTPMGWNDRPQTWVSAAMCLLGVGILELCGADVSMSIGLGDGLAVVQAMGFGTSIFMCEHMMKEYPTKALPVTSAMVATTAFIAMLWSFCEGWIGTVDNWQSMTLPNLFFDPSMREVAMAVAWTGLLSTSMNFSLEVYALGKVPSGEASVILATEPMWAAAFASLLLGEQFGWNDYVGGFLIVAACVVNSLKPSDLHRWLPGGERED